MSDITDIKIDFDAHLWLYVCNSSGMVSDTTDSPSALYETLLTGISAV
jgi:hypothetical protein